MISHASASRANDRLFGAMANCSCPGVIPVSLARLDGCLVALEAVLEEVEDGKLIAGHDIGVGLGLDLAPDL